MRSLPGVSGALFFPCPGPGANFWEWSGSSLFHCPVPRGLFSVVMALPVPFIAVQCPLQRAGQACYWCRWYGPGSSFWGASVLSATGHLADSFNLHLAIRHFDFNRMHAKQGIMSLEHCRTFFGGNTDSSLVFQMTNWHRGRLSTRRA